MENKTRFYPLGDTGIKIEFSEQVSSSLSRKIKGFCELLRQSGISGIIEWVPTYTGVSVYYDPVKIEYNEMSDELIKVLGKESLPEEESSEMIHIPVVYGGEHGEDLEKVAKSHGLSGKEVIDIHSGKDYLIHMIGFLPGFPYLGGMSPRIATPRLENPRSRVPAGSVGIAGEQTGIYPLESPGGWNIIGRTPVQLFSPDQENPFLYQAGDYIRFVPVTETEFNTIRYDVRNGNYVPERTARPKEGE